LSRAGQPARHVHASRAAVRTANFNPIKNKYGFFRKKVWPESGYFDTFSFVNSSHWSTVAQRVAAGWALMLCLGGFFFLVVVEQAVHE
jgi:hypothetical protein